MKSIERYNRVKALDARAARALARPDNGERVFEKHCEVEAAQWHATNGALSLNSPFNFLKLAIKEQGWISLLVAFLIVV